MKNLELPFSYKDVQDVEKLIQNHLRFFNDQLLEPDWFVVFIDAYHTQVGGSKGTLRKVSLFTALGIDLEARKFKKYPEEVRPHIYTTNPVESINAGLEDMRNRMGGLWGSVKALEVNMFIQFASLQSLWDRKPMANVRAKLYEIRQLFGLRFELDEVENDVALHNF